MSSTQHPAVQRELAAVLTARNHVCLPLYPTSLHHSVPHLLTCRAVGQSIGAICYKPKFHVLPPSGQEADQLLLAGSLLLSCHQLISALQTAAAAWTQRYSHLPAAEEVQDPSGLCMCTAAHGVTVLGMKPTVAVVCTSLCMGSKALLSDCGHVLLTRVKLSLCTSSRHTPQPFCVSHTQSGRAEAACCCTEPCNAAGSLCALSIRVRGPHPTRAASLLLSAHQHATLPAAMNCLCRPWLTAPSRSSTAASATRPPLP